ncbi:MAG TPA: LPS-assembly protein LptD [Roseiarcus sp.]|nr:LPS-assembly protein LptD [Roseiarcus sp.]
MGRPARPPESGKGRRRSLALGGGALAFVLAGLILLSPACISPSLAQAASAAAKPANPGAKKPDKMLVQANELVFDKDKNTVSAVGDAQIYYQGRILEADRVVYDRAKKRVYAEGHAKFTDEHGDVTYGSRFELTQDFRDGFIDSVQTLTKDKARFSSPRVERSEGVVTVFEKGTYTACEPCKDHPERPPLWQVRSARIIHNNQTHTVYYEDSTLELAGVPIAYIPYFSAPDPTVTRQSGVLAPHFIRDTRLGYGFGVPYFFDLAPNYDLTVDPTLLSRQGLLGDVEWRHRLDNGAYTIRATGIFQQDPKAFLPAPYGSGGERFRGSVETAGRFYINDRWAFGWNITALTDRYYFADYKLKTEDISHYYIADVVSSVYLRGQGDRGFFDLSGYHFEGLTQNDFEKQEPFAAPVLDYNKTIDIPGADKGGLGGQATIDVNVTSVSREAALYQSTGLQTLDKAFSLYNVCTTYTPGKCMVRGVAGNYSRASLQLSWQRKFIDPIGEVWTPFIFARLDGEETALNTNQTFTFVNGAITDSISNSMQPAFFAGQQSDVSDRAMPGIGLEYRYPWFSSTPIGSQVIEPIAQVIARPNEINPKLQPNEDAQSLIFDDTTLFEWNKYSGYDRIEGGGRLNYGAQYTLNFNNGGHLNLVGGESIHLFGVNSFAVPDAANTGLESGLDKKYSDFVARQTFAPISAVSFSTKEQFDSSTLAMKRFDFITSATYGPLTTTLDFGRYAAQPELGYFYAREGLLTSAKYKFADHWSVNGTVVFDMSRHYYDVAGQSTPVLYAPTYGFGVGYSDECTTVNLSYTSTLTDPIASTPGVRDQTVLLQITLRTLGELRASTSIGESAPETTTPYVQ